MNAIIAAAVLGLVAIVALVIYFANIRSKKTTTELAELHQTNLELVNDLSYATRALTKIAGGLAEPTTEAWATLDELDTRAVNRSTRTLSP